MVAVAAAGEATAVAASGLLRLWCLLPSAFFLAAAAWEVITTAAIDLAIGAGMTTGALSLLDRK